MPTYQETKILNHNAHNLYKLVLDIEEYPNFLPWCSAARILKHEGEEIYAELVISFKSFHERYTSKITKVTDIDDGKYSVIVDMVEGPFEHLVNRWEFQEMNERQTEIKFYIDFKFKSKILEAMIGLFFEKAIDKMSDAFEERAAELGL